MRIPLINAVFLRVTEPPSLRSSPKAAPLARVDGLGPSYNLGATTARQAIFLGATEPRAARPGSLEDRRLRE